MSAGTQAGDFGFRLDLDDAVARAHRVQIGEVRSLQLQAGRHRVVDAQGHAAQHVCGVFQPFEGRERAVSVRVDVANDSISDGDSWRDAQFQRHPIRLDRDARRLEKLVEPMRRHACAR